MRICASFALIVLALSLAIAAPAQAKPAAQANAEFAAQTLAQTPPMGWNSWNFFAGNVTDKDIRAAADQLVATGMKDAGYVYVNIDDTWEGERDADGVLHTNSKFPDMKALADYVHSKGLKFGIYSAPRLQDLRRLSQVRSATRSRTPRLYASWGIDYLKYDLCSFIPEVMQKQAPNDEAAQMRLMVAAYAKMGKALKADRPPHRLLALPVRLGRAVGVGARSGRQSVAHHRRHAAQLEQHLRHHQPAGRTGKIRRPRPLERSRHARGGQRQRLRSLAENRSHFSMWAMLAAPLLAGNDLPNMKPEIKAILTNRDVIAIDQDPLGREGRRAYVDGEVEVWTRHLSGGALAVAIFNTGYDRYASHPFHLNLTQTRPPRHRRRPRTCGPARRLTLTDNQPIELPIHDILLLRIDAPK